MNFYEFEKSQEFYYYFLLKIHLHEFSTNDSSCVV